MANTDAPTGTAGTIRISDDGSVIGYWILCSDPQTTVGSQYWNGTINGRNVEGTVNLPKGFGSVLVFAEIVSTTQAVLFNMAASGTQGLGGPASVSAQILRGPPPTVPAQMAAPTVTDVTLTGMTLHWQTPANGGSALDQILLRRYPTEAVQDGTGEVNYGYTPGVTQGVITDLARATPYWWVVYARNAVGYSPQSPATASRTLGGAYVSDADEWKPAEVLASDGLNWKPAALLISDAGEWKAAG